MPACIQLIFQKKWSYLKLTGPLFFGAAYKFRDAIKLIRKKPKVLIISMTNVPVVDATGIHTIKDVLNMCRQDKIHLIISGVQPQVFEELKKIKIIIPHLEKDM